MLLYLAGEKKLDKLDHVAVQVADIDRGVNWYLETFNCEVEYKDETWALLNFDNVRLALVKPEQHPGHFAVERNDAGQFGQLTRHRDGTETVYINDPWENIIEILKAN